MSDPNRLVVWIEDLDGSEECPSCGRDFDLETARSDWEHLDGRHYRSGGYTLYGCPNDGCDGEVEVTI